MNQPTQSQSKKLLPIISVITLLGFLDTTLLTPIMALYAAELGASIGLIGLIVGLYSITNTPANILFGRVIDRVGYKIPLVVGLIGDALSMFLYSLTRLPFHLALVRALHGMPGALIGPATMSVFADYGGRGRGRVMSIYGMALAAAPLIGFALSGVIASRLGYSTLFFIGAGLLIIGVILSLLLPGSKKERTTAVRTSLSAVLRQLKSLLSRRGLSLAYCSIFAQYFTFGGLVTLLPIYVKGLGMEAFHVGMLLAAFTVTFILSQFPSGALSDKVGRLPPTVIGLSLGIVSMVILPWLTTFPQLVIIMALFGIGYGLFFPSISSLVAEHALTEERGLATGLFHALLTGGVAIGAPVVGWLGESIGLQMGLMLAPVFLVLALALVLTSLKRI